MQGPKTEAAAAEALANAVAEGGGLTPACGELIHHRVDGKPWRSAVAALPLVDGSGQLLYRLWLVCDADDRRRREHCSEPEGWAAKWMEQVGRVVWCGVGLGGGSASAAGYAASRGV